MSYKVHSFRKTAGGNLGLEAQILHRNFKGEPWAVPRQVYFYGTPSSSEYLKDLKPIFQIVRAMGILPLRFRDNGRVEFRLMSPMTLYTLLVQCTMVAMTYLIMKERVQRMEDPTMKFGDLVLEVGCILCFSFIFLVPTNHLPESAKKARFLSSWNNFQKQFCRATGRPLILNLRSQEIRKLVASFIVSVIFTGLLFGLQIGFKWWQGIPFFYSCFLSFLLTDFWVLTTNAFTITIEHLETSLIQHVTLQDRKIDEYTELWYHLSKLTRDLGNSMGYTYGGQVLLYFTLQVVGIYGFISQVKVGRTWITAGFSVTAIVFTWFTYVLCNTSHKVTSRLGPEFQEKLRSIVRNVWLHAETRAEMKIFQDTVTSYPPVINLCGFVQLNRGLQITMLSSIVTYLVVLTQFQQSS